MNAISPLPIDRRAERTQLFLVATLTFGRASAPVRVRNLSASGALVEAGSLPPVGSTITLRRGELEALGTIVWLEPGKAGLTFNGIVDVSHWLPTKDGKRPLRIDPIAAEVLQARGPQAEAEAAGTLASMVAEMVVLQAQLGQLGATLAADAAVVAHHPDVRLLEGAAQQIGRMVTALKDRTT